MESHPKQELLHCFALKASSKVEILLLAYIKSADQSFQETEMQILYELK